MEPKNTKDVNNEKIAKLTEQAFAYPPSFLENAYDSPPKIIITTPNIVQRLAVLPSCMSEDATMKDTTAPTKIGIFQSFCSATGMR